MFSYQKAMVKGFDMFALPVSIFKVGLYKKARVGSICGAALSFVLISGLILYLSVLLVRMRDGLDDVF